jgi:hypothetical protein
MQNYWRLIETQGGGSPVIVMNWSRGLGWHIDEVKLRQKDSRSIVDFLRRHMEMGLTACETLCIRN